MTERDCSLSDKREARYFSEKPQAERKVRIQYEVEFEEKELMMNKQISEQKSKIFEDITPQFKQLSLHDKLSIGQNNTVESIKPNGSQYFCKVISHQNGSDKLCLSFVQGFCPNNDSLYHNFSIEIPEPVPCGPKVCEKFLYNQCPEEVESDEHNDTIKENFGSNIINESGNYPSCKYGVHSFRRFLISKFRDSKLIRNLRNDLCPSFFARGFCKSHDNGQLCGCNSQLNQLHLEYEKNLINSSFFSQNISHSIYQRLYAAGGTFLWYQDGPDKYGLMIDEVRMTAKEKRENKPPYRTLCFPGGKKEISDHNSIHTGLRELFEETKYLFPIDFLQTVYHELFFNKDKHCFFWNLSSLYFLHLYRLTTQSEIELLRNIVEKFNSLEFVAKLKIVNFRDVFNVEGNDFPRLASFIKRWRFFKNLRRL